MVYAAVKGGPINEGFFLDVVDRNIRDQPGIQSVVKGKTWLAVVADRYWQAKKALDSLKPDFNFRSAEQIDTTWAMGNIRNALSKNEAHIYESDGDALQLISVSKRKISAEYEVPYLSHAALEPMNATARVNVDGSIEIWAPVQSITLVIQSVAAALDVEAEKIRVYPTLVGGGFGIKTETDACVQAAICAQTTRKPVQVIWSRDEDFKQDKYRPSAVARLTAALDETGKIAAFHCRMAGQSATGSMTDRYFPSFSSHEPDIASVQGATKIPYDFGARQIAHAMVKLPIPVGFWRSVGHSYTAFFVESFMDEVARSASQDPVAYRLSLLGAAKRHANVLKECALKAGPRVEGRGRGYALHESFGSIVAQAVDVALNTNGEAEVKRVICVVDCGSVVHPDTIVGQIEGGIIFGLSAAMTGKVEFEQGYAKVDNFDAYPILTLAQCPDIEVHIVESGHPIGGIGEVAVPPVAPAVTNAIFDLTGVRLRQLPIAGQKLLGEAQLQQMQRLEEVQGGVVAEDLLQPASENSQEEVAQ
jgi:isoquinoline 1-oxidoreductase beta subunit